MKKIAIDCRMINSSGIGTYLKGILPYLLGTNNKFLIIGNKEELQKFLKYENVEFQECNIKIFSIKELINFPIEQINKCDIFYTPNFNIPLGIKIPIYLTIHDIIFLDMPELTSKIGYYLRKFYYKLAYSKATKIFTVSNFSKKRIQYFLGTQKEIIVTYNGISDYILKDSNENYIKKDYLIFVGNIKKHKGLKILLKAFELLKRDGSNLKLMIVGNQKNFRTKDKEVINLLENQKLNKDIIFTGYVENNELKKLIAEAKILIQPSLYEGFGIPPLEALALGTNAIVSDIEVFKEIYSDLPVTFFRVNDEIDLKEKITNESDIQKKFKEFFNEYTYKQCGEVIKNYLLR